MVFYFFHCKFVEVPKKGYGYGYTKVEDEPTFSLKSIPWKGCLRNLLATRVEVPKSLNQAIGRNPPIFPWDKPTRSEDEKQKGQVFYMQVIHSEIFNRKRLLHSW